MKTKKLIVITVCIVLAAFAIGATGILHLVGTSENEDSSSDRLIGILITREYLDLFDSEQFLSDNINSFVNGEEISESDSAKYQGKLYATLVETTHTNDETGEIDSRKEYVFEGINGICYFTTQVTDQFGTYWSSSGDDAITDGNINLNSTDEGESVSMEGTIYVSTRGNARNFYFNPVYQTPTGDVYAVSGEGMSFGVNSAAGMSMSHEIKENQSSTIGDLTTSHEAEIKVTICYMDEPEKVSILQFGAGNELFSKIEYDPNDFPNSLQVQSGTQYIIIETTTFSHEQGRNITREIYQPEDETLFAFLGRDDGICVKQECEIVWNN